MVCRSRPLFEASLTAPMNSVASLLVTVSWYRLLRQRELEFGSSSHDGESPGDRTVSATPLLPCHTHCTEASRPAAQKLSVIACVTGRGQFGTSYLQTVRLWMLMDTIVPSQAFSRNPSWSACRRRSRDLRGALHSPIRVRPFSNPSCPSAPAMRLSGLLYLLPRHIVTDRRSPLGLPRRLHSRSGIKPSCRGPSWARCSVNLPGAPPARAVVPA
jgi:hypothetical protein